METTLQKKKVTITDIACRYNQATGIEDINLEIQPGEMLVLLGPSGCGKTTLLRTIAGLMSPDEGTILFGDKDVTKLPASKRDIGMVFQTWALFPHLTVAENVAFGLKMRKLAANDISEKVAEALEMVQLGHLADRKPSQLSGGQQQRVALARAIVINPSLLLLDEPLSALDRKIRMTLRVELRQLQQSLGLTGIYVTHDHGEALALGDRVAVMDSGRIVEINTPREIFVNPQKRFTAEFLDAGTVIDLPQTKDIRNGKIITPVGELAQAEVADDVTALCVPADAVTIVQGTSATGIPAQVLGLDYEQASLTVMLELTESKIRLKCVQPLSSVLQVGDAIQVTCDLSKAILLRD